MSIDDYAGGAGRGAASLLYRNRDGEFPGWAGRDLAGAGYTGQVLARDGATVAEVLERQLPRLSSRPALVTVTMGGNDLLAGYGDDAAAEAAVGRVAALGEAVLVRLRRLGGDGCRIVLTTVYDPSDGSGRVPGSGLPAWPRGPGWIRSLNDALVGLAGRHGAVVADVYGRFVGHGRPYERGLWYCGVVEPNAWGAHEIRSCWWQALGDQR